MEKFLPPDIEIELQEPGGAIQKRRLRNDLGAVMALQKWYYDWELHKTDKQEALTQMMRALANANLFEVVPRLLFAYTSHERVDGETAETFAAMVGMSNFEYISERVGLVNSRQSNEAYEDDDPTTAPNGSIKRSRTGKRSKPSQKSDSESRQNASIQ